MVVLILEDHTRKITLMLPILRDPAGKFTEFADPGPLLFGDPAGRFAGLMPRHPPTARQTAAAQAALLALGMEFASRGFEPGMN